MLQKKRWTKEEINELKRRRRIGFRPDTIMIGTRSRKAIKYKFYQLGLKSGRRWKKKELVILKREIKSGKRPEDIKIKGRTKIAIIKKAISASFHKTKKRVCQNWNTKELKKLKELVKQGKRPKQIVDDNCFPKRSLSSIAHQIERMGYKYK